MFSYMKTKALSYEGQIPKELREYQKAQKKFAMRSFEVASLKELLYAIEKSRIVYLGDFHTFDQSSKNLARLLKRLTEKKNHNIVLGIEFVEESNQLLIDDYINHNITELEFLESINYHESWRFPWSYYGIFFEMAKNHNFEIIALNSKGTLKERDLKAAEIISNYITNFADTTFLVLFGELHIVPEKLPKLVSNILSGLQVNQTIIHQNLDEVYWKLKEIKSENQIIKFNDFEFCIQTSAPWIKYESMIYWYENLSDDPHFDIHEYIIEQNAKLFTDDVNYNFLYLCQEILKSFNIEAIKEDQENFNLYDQTNLEYILTKIDSLKKASARNFYKGLVQRGKPFKIPFTADYYCPSYSINRLSYLAGIHIHTIILKAKKVKHENILLGNDQVKKFLYLIHRFMMAYFSSKIINPYRKCYLYQDILREYQNSNVTKIKKKYFKLTLDILDHQDNLKNLLKNNYIRIIHSTAKLIGFILSDNIYDNHYHKNSWEFSQFIYYLTRADLNEESFWQILRIILPSDIYQKQKKRFF